MDAQRWRRAGAIFDQMVEVASHERSALLDRLCGNDVELRHDVAALLAADAAAASLEAGIDLARSLAAAEWMETEEHESARTGARVGPWRVLGELGRGGMGVVCLAERADGAYEQRAALKLILRGMDSDAVQARFVRERNILARLEHPHIARLLDGGVAADGRPYFAMEFIDGKPLLGWCAENKTKIDERIRIFLDICAAVQFAHGRLVVHRDIKPANILVTAAGEAKLLDFGIATLLDYSGNAGTTIDAQHQPLTPAYAAPEQLRGEAATTASDIYALGCVIYELLTGRRPLAPCDAPTLEQMRRAQETTDPAAPSRVAAAPVAARHLRGDLDTILLKALQREPARRYATVEAFAEDLRRFLGGRPIAARRDSTGYRLRKFVGRHRFGVAASALGVLALVGALAFALLQTRAQAREAETSRQVTLFLAGLFKGADPELSRRSALSAEDLLDQGTQRLQADAQMPADVRARLLDTVAATYTSLGLYDRALPLARHALELRGGGPDGERADSLFTLGRILRLKARYDDAAPLLDEALRLRRRSLAQDDPAVIESLRESGALLRGRGEFAQADVVLSEALRLARRRYGAESIESAAAEDDYAANLDDMGRRIDAEAAYRHALAMRERLRGADDPEVATSLVNLGTHLDDSGDYATAVPLLERAVVIRKKIFGAEHPLVGLAELALAGVYESQDRLDECVRTAQHALAIFRHGLPEDHPKISESLNLLGIARQERRDFAGAVPLMQEVLARYRRTLGEDHPDTLTAQNNLAYALAHVGRLQEAEHLQRDVLARMHADNGQPVDATVSENLAGTLAQQGKYAEAVNYARRAVEIHRRRDGDGAANTAVALRTLGGIEEASGAAADAERDFRAALAIGEALASQRKDVTYAWKIPLADLLAGTGRCAAAVPLLDDALSELGVAGRRYDPAWQPEARLLLGECRGAAAMQERRAARAALRALPGIEVDLYPTARGLLAAGG